MTHELRGLTLVKTEHGNRIFARCSCGWTTPGSFSNAGASAAFKSHAEPVGGERNRPGRHADDFDGMF